MPLSKKHIGSGSKEAIAAREEIRRQSGLGKNYKPIAAKKDAVHEDAVGDPEYYRLMLGTSNLTLDDL